MKIKAFIREKMLQCLGYFQYLLFFSKNNKARVLVYSVMPPENTGMAPFALNIFNKREDFIVFSKHKYLLNYFNCLFSQKHFNKNVYPFELEKLIEKRTDVQSKIFVIGNSSHHKYTLDKAIDTKGENNRYLYLGENYVMGFLIEYFKLNTIEKIKNFIYKYYQKNVDIEKQNIYESLTNANIYGTKILSEITGIKNFIVFSDNAIEFFKKDFGENEFADLNIKIAPTVIPSFNRKNNPQNTYENRDYIMVGSFGISQKNKSTDDIVKAVNCMNAKGEKTKLLLAGYKVNNYIKALPENITTEHIIAIENPNQNKLYELMASVDVAVQLRSVSHGELSGCISELLGLNKKVITTKNFVPNSIKKFCVEVEPFIAPEALANVISDELIRKNELDFTQLNTLDFKNCAEKIYEMTIESGDKK